MVELIYMAQKIVACWLHIDRQKHHTSLHPPLVSIFKVKLFLQLKVHVRVAF